MDFDFLKYDTPEQMFADSGLELVKTCDACPEQYDVYKGDKQIAYMRLRHGYFYVTRFGEKIHDAEPKGDGCFQVEERMFHLHKALTAILN